MPNLGAESSAGLMNHTSMMRNVAERVPLVNAAGLWTLSTAAYGGPGDEEIALARAWIRQWAEARCSINPRERWGARRGAQR